jgi:hypothetical protein
VADWTPKASAPVAFNGVDALLSLIHGDPVWGWLEGWVHLYPSSYINTAEFCSIGPWNVGTLNLGDLLNAANPMSNDYVEGVARTDVKVIGVLHDRLFAAMCEQVPAAGEAWGTIECYDLVDSPGQRAGTVSVGTVPAGATLARRASWTPSGTNYFANMLWLGKPEITGTNANWQVHRSEGDWEAADPTPWAVEAGSTINVYSDHGVTGQLCIQYNVAGEPTPFVPAEQPQPDGYTPRVIPPTDTIADVGPLLANIEFKLEYVINMVQGLVGGAIPLPGGTTDPEELTPDVPVPVGDAIGAIFTASEIPASVSLDFGSPQNVIRLCHINFGNASGWYPSIWMTHTPFIVRPLPIGTTQLTTTAVIPGATISYELIKRETPAPPPPPPP